MSEVDALQEIAEADIEKARVSRPFPKRELASRSVDDLRTYFHGDGTLLTKRDLRGLDQIHRLTSASLDKSNAREERDRAMNELREVMVAMQNNRRPLIPPAVGLLLPWKMLFRNHDRSIGNGSFPADNLATKTPAASRSVVDLSLIDPRNSTLWRPPSSIGEQDLHAGFDRAGIPAIAEGLCEYVDPKTSSGTKPGFEVEWNGDEYQVKFLEVSSEPFTARIFHALGYYVDPTDYAPSLKVRYNRRLFREFNMRAPLTMRFRPLGIPLGNTDLQPYYSPFDFIVSAVFKDGRSISGAELRQHLFHHPSGRHPEEDPGNYRIEVEESLDYLVTTPANIQRKDQPSQTIGMWDFAGLGHDDWRELRGAGLLAAWLGWFDVRFDNTRLRVLETNGVVQIQHFFTDLGAGMGGGDGWLVRHGEDPKYFEPVFTRTKTSRRSDSKFEVIHYETVFPCSAFQAMTLDDARWMARLIGQLTKAQLRDALVASGYDIATTELYLQKLISRRDQMILDLGLGDEISLLKHLGE